MPHPVFGHPLPYRVQVQCNPAKSAGQASAFGEGRREDGKGKAVGSDREAGSKPDEGNDEDFQFSRYRGKGGMSVAENAVNHPAGRINPPGSGEKPAALKEAVRKWVLL